VQFVVHTENLQSELLAHLTLRVPCNRSHTPVYDYIRIIVLSLFSTFRPVHQHLDQCYLQFHLTLFLSQTWSQNLQIVTWYQSLVIRSRALQIVTYQPVISSRYSFFFNGIYNHVWGQIRWKGAFWSLEI
jgi:hypothetical protein